MVILFSMNRAPSLLHHSISGHTVKIIEVGDTIRISVNVADSIYCDFDGDCMTALVPHNLIAKTECSILNNLENSFISYKDTIQVFGVYHDALIGLSEFTSDNIRVNRYNAMRLLSQTDQDISKYKLDKEIYNGREIISMLLPEINYNRKSGHYNPDYINFIDYKPEEIKVEIRRGEIISGKLDKKIVGQGVDGSIFHIINNEYGSTKALDVIYNIQQVTILFQMFNGFTLNFDDISINKEALNIIYDKTSSILYESELITKKLYNGNMIPPIGLTIEEYYEQHQLSVLNLGDDYLLPVLKNINTNKNNLYKLISSGTKGKPTNLLQIN